jgi:hypothetical protein
MWLMLTDVDDPACMIPLAHPGCTPTCTRRYPVRQDAFHTIMQWLMGRIPYVKANKWGAGSPQ